MARLKVLACAFACAAPGTEGFTGGESTLGWSILRQIARFHEVWALTRAVDRESIEQNLAENPVPNLHFHYFELPSMFLPLLRIQGGHQIYYWLWQIQAYFVAKKLQKKIGFDLFHHVTYANDWMASLIGAYLPIPYIRGPGGGAHRTPRGFEKEYSFTGRFWEKIRSAGQWLFRHDPSFIKGHSRASAIMVCNREAMSAIPQKWAQKARFFPVNGISSNDLEIAKPLEGPPKDVFKVLSAGTLIKVKGFGLAMKAFDEFAGRHPESTLTIIGSGPEGPKLHALAKSLASGDKIKLVPHLTRDELLTEMASHDVFLFPSLRDGGGAVVIEAMAAGKPVVCLDTGGPGMHVTSDCGIKVFPLNVEDASRQLGQALDILFLDEDLRRKLGSAARKKATDEYHWDRLGDQLKDVYDRALNPEVVPTI